MLTNMPVQIDGDRGIKGEEALIMPPASALEQVKNAFAIPRS